MEYQIHGRKYKISTWKYITIYKNGLIYDDTNEGLNLYSSAHEYIKSDKMFTGLKYIGDTYTSYFEIAAALLKDLKKHQDNSKAQIDIINKVADLFIID